MYGVETTINSKDRHRFYCLNYSVVVYYHLFGESLSFYDSEVNQPVAFLNEVVNAVVSLSKRVTNCLPHNNVQMVQHKLSYCL